MSVTSEHAERRSAMQRDVEQTRTRQCSRALSRAARRSPHLAHLFLLEDTLTSERSASLLVICLPTQVRPNKSYWPLTFVRVQSCFIGLRGSKRNLGWTPAAFWNNSSRVPLNSSLNFETAREPTRKYRSLHSALLLQSPQLLASQLSYSSKTPLVTETRWF